MRRACSRRARRRIYVMRAAGWKRRASCTPLEIADAFGIRGAARDEAPGLEAVGEALEARLGDRGGARPEAGAVIALEGGTEQLLRHIGEERRRDAREPGGAFGCEPVEHRLRGALECGEFVAPLGGAIARGDEGGVGGRPARAGSVENRVASGERLARIRLEELHHIQL